MSSMEYGKAILKRSLTIIVAVTIIVLPYFVMHKPALESFSVDYDGYIVPTSEARDNARRPLNVTANRRL